MADPAGLTLTEVVGAVRAGRLRPGDVWQACRQRVEKRDAGLAAWASLDRGDPDVAPPGPLRGGVLGVKDVIHAAGLPTRAGSGAFEVLPGEDAPAVASLRNAGAAILGKTACTEFATNDPAPTRNPWDGERTPGGSSPGSAVAVATGMCHATLDTQTAGDVLRPAAYNGVVGFKPGYGRVSRRGTVGVAWSIDTLGVQARCVDDVQLLYEVLSGDAARHAAPQSAPAVGALRDPLLDRSQPAVEDELRRVTGALTRAGATVREVRPPLELEVAVAAHRIVTFTECAALHEDRYRSSRAELGPKFRALLELGLVTPAASYVRAQRVRGRIVAGLEAVLGTVDA